MPVKSVKKKSRAPIKKWDPIYKGMSKDALKTSFRNNRQYTLAKDKYTATEYDNFMAMAIATRDRLVERWILTQQNYHRKNLKRVYYLSMEFLPGRLLADNIINLGMQKEAQEALKDMGMNYEELIDQERDAGLGNGGLGRLAACFLDSMATLGIPAHGYGIRYDYGIFRQRIVGGCQVESPDEWLKQGNPWEIARPEYTVKIKFYGNTHMSQDKDGRLRVEWRDTQNVLAMPYDIPVPGFENDVVNTLRLWSARGTEEFDLGYFNDGDYEKAVYSKLFSENISKVLYPNDGVSQGRLLRLKQEYFFTAASISDIIRRFKVENTDFRTLPDKVAIQLNDTHPALALVEFMRILIDEERLEWETAWGITVRTFAYTNHTVMPEALECWQVPLLESLLPRHMQIIYEINSRFLRQVMGRFPSEPQKLSRMSLIEEGEVKRVRMSYLCIVGSHSVNGVSRLHTEILKKQLFRDFFEFSPEKFNNKTNGITQRRWLKKSNPGLSDLITGAIGKKWLTNLYELKDLERFASDASFRRKWQEVKAQNKRMLTEHVRRMTGIIIDPDSIFDVQVKRIHEYKRQTLFCLYIISRYLDLKKNKGKEIVPRTFLFSGKAAPGYFMAKLIIRFINSIAAVINGDREMEDKMKVIFLENYGVSLAEKIFPASDLSEQISTAGTEASGTGCMKFMMNGALTIGTLDGANVEIAEAVGSENIFIFGMQAEEINRIHAKGYNPQEYISRSPELKEILKLVRSDFFSPSEPGTFEPLVQSLMNNDPFMTCADFESYCKTQEAVSGAYLDRKTWAQKSILNTARSGKFSSDRTIEEYAMDIWKVACEKR